ncbi:MAG: type VI-B CRISPR-associated RNA-guided ribonuclease Cas13b [Prolixibacteraceae bacterium]
MNEDAKTIDIRDKAYKKYFTIYFNDAVHQTEAVYNEVYSIINRKKNNDTTAHPRFSKLLDCDAALSEFEKLYNILLSYYPVLRPLREIIESHSIEDGLLKEKDIVKKVFSTLDRWIEQVENYRNYFSHYGFYRTFPKASLVNIDLLDDVFSKARQREVFKRKNPTACPKPFTKAMTECFESKLEACLKERPNEIEEQIRYWVLKDISESVNGNFSLRYKKEDLSNYGILYLLFFFIRKKEAEELLNITYGLKGTHAIEFQFSRWAFTSFCFRGVKNKITSEEKDYRNILLMQMADYLSCVPDEVYRHLTSAQKEEFIYDVNEFISPSKDRFSELLPVTHNVVRKRYENKFEYFALRFIDEILQPEDLRFQVYAGNLLKDKRKKDENGFQYDREIKVPIYLYERLSTVVKKKAEIESQYNLEASDAHKVELFPNPSYHIENNQIKLAFALNQKSDSEIQGGIYGSCSFKNELREQLSASGVKEKGWCHLTISSHDLVALLYRLLKGDGRLRTIFMSELGNRKSALKALIKAQKVDTIENIKPGDDNQNKKEKDGEDSKEKNDHSDNPYYHLFHIKQWNKRHKVSNTTLNEPLQYNRLETDLEKHIKALEKRLKREEDPAHIGNREKGLLVTWVAHRMVRWMMPEERNQWKGYHHRELQTLLGSYRLDFAQIRSLYYQKQSNSKAILKYSWKADLDNTLSGSEFRKFYFRFVRFEIDQYRYFLERVNASLTLDDEMFVVVGTKNYRPSTYVDYLETLQNATPALRRGIFDPKPTYVKGKSVREFPNLYADWFVETNKQTEEFFQQFYCKPIDWEYRYRESDVEKDKDPLKEELNIKKWIYKEKAKIRKAKSEDQAILWMIQYIFHKMNTTDMVVNDENPIDDLTLSDCYLTRSEKENRAQEAKSQSVRKVGDCSDAVYKQTNVFEKIITLNNNERIKLKDYPSYLTKKRDPLVQTLMSYDNTLSIVQIEQELYGGVDSYFKVQRDMVWKVIFDLEKTLLERARGSNKNDYPSKFEKGGYPNFRKMIQASFSNDYNDNLDHFIESLLRDKIDHTNKELLKSLKPKQKSMILVILLRNKFAHSQLPSLNQKKVLEKLIGTPKKSTYANWYYKILNNEIKKMLK